MADLDTNDVPEENVNIIGPDGKLGSVAPSEVPKYVGGPFGNYRLATDQDVQHYVEKQQYTSLPSQVAGTLETTLSAPTFGLSRYAETGLSKLGFPGLSPEEQQKREEYLPGVVKGAASTLGIALPAIVTGGTSLGALGLMESAGAGAAELAGLGAARGVLPKIGSAAIKTAVANAVFQTGDEVGKLAMSDKPQEVLENALPNIGMASLLGGILGTGFGSVGALWSAAAGPKLTGLLQGLRNQMGGIEGQMPDAIGDALDRSGLSDKTPPEIKAILSGDEQSQQFYKDLRQNPDPSGVKMQKADAEYRSVLSNRAAEALQKTPEQIDQLTNISPSKEGASIANSIADEFKSKLEGPASEFEDLKASKRNIFMRENQEITDPDNPYQNKVVPGTMSEASERLGQLASDQKWSEDSDSMKVLRDLQKDLPKQKTIGDLTDLISRKVSENWDPLNPQLNRDVQAMASILRDHESDAVIDSFGQQAPEILQRAQAAKEDWKQLSELKDLLQSRLRLKGAKSNAAFVDNLRTAAEESPEKFLNKISTTNDATLSDLLQKEFPQTSESIRSYQTDQLLKKAMMGAPEGSPINLTKLFRQIDSLTPETRTSLFTPETQAKLDGVRTLHEILTSLDRDKNFSNTAPTLMRYIQGLAGPQSTISGLIEEIPVVGKLIKAIVGYVGHSAPNAAKLALLKSFGSAQPASGTGFKAMADFLLNAQKGNGLINNAIKSLFESGKDVIPSRLIPDQKKRDKLEGQINKLNENQTALLNSNSHLMHYMPEQGGAIAQTAMTTLSYLNSIRPTSVKTNPLDSELKPSKDQMAQYHQALDIAEQPLIVLQKIKNGTLNSQDIQTFGTLFPSLHKNLIQKITNELTSNLEEGASISYKTRMGLSLFMGQPLDSTMAPQNIQMIQMALHTNVAPSQQGMPSTKHSSNALNKFAKSDMTPGQAREAQRLKT